MLIDWIKRLLGQKWGASPSLQPVRVGAPSKKRVVLLLALLACLLQGCCYRRAPQCPPPNPIAVEVEEKNPYVLTLYADARGLDYSSGKALYKSLKLQQGSRNTHGIFGHTWIRLKGVQGEEIVVVEGGHSGDLGQKQPQYMDGVLAQVKARHHNPISYLWITKEDGFFQRGSGGHNPTHRAVIVLNEEQYWDVLNYIDPANYDYPHYALTDRQCVSYCARIAERVGVDLKYKANISIPNKVQILTMSVRLWEDPRYSNLSLGLPDVLVLNSEFERISQPTRVK